MTLVARIADLATRIKNEVNAVKRDLFKTQALTRSQFDSLANTGKLVPNRLYYISDESKLAVATGRTVYALMAAGTAAGTAAALPAVSLAPTITGTPTQGQTLTSTLGTWTGFPVPALSRQWLRNGVPITGANAATYTLVADDVGKQINLRVAGTNSEGLVSAVATEVGPVAAVGVAGPYTVVVTPVTGLAAPVASGTTVATVSSTGNTPRNYAAPNLNVTVPANTPSGTTLLTLP